MTYDAAMGRRMRVLLATDGSSDATAATQWLGHLPLPADREVLVVTVMKTPLLPVVPAVVGELHATLVADARRLADGTASALVRPGSSATGRVVEGDPREEIVDAARGWGADLIVLGARGVGAITELLLGSVSLGVARQAPCPVLVCKGTPRDLRAVTVAVDGSEHARDALAFILALPLAADVRLQLVNAVEPQHYPSSAPGAVGETVRAALAMIDAERRALAEKECAAAAETVHARRLAVTAAVQPGRAADVIVREAQTHGSDLVVVGARGLGAVERLLLGSVSESVLRHAPCPVLIVRPRQA